MKFENRQEECELVEINTKGYCNWGVRSYGGARKCDHPSYMHLKAFLYCPYFWRKKKSDMET